MPTRPANRSRTGVGRQQLTQHESQLLQQAVAPQQLGSQHAFLQQPLPQPLLQQALLPQQVLAWQQLGSLAAAWQQLGSQAFAPQHDVSQQLDGQQLPPSIRSIRPLPNAWVHNMALTASAPRTEFHFMRASSPFEGTVTVRSPVCRVAHRRKRFPKGGAPRLASEVMTLGERVTRGVYGGGQGGGSRPQFGRCVALVPSGRSRTRLGVSRRQAPPLRYCYCTQSSGGTTSSSAAPRRALERSEVIFPKCFTTTVAKTLPGRQGSQTVTVATPEATDTTPSSAGHGAAQALGNSSLPKRRSSVLLVENQVGCTGRIALADRAVRARQLDPSDHARVAVRANASVLGWSRHRGGPSPFAAVARIGRVSHDQ